MIRPAKKWDIAAVGQLYRSVIGTPFCTWDDSYPGKGEIETDVENGNLYLLTNDAVIVGALSVVSSNELDSLEFWTPAEHPHELARIVISPKFQGNRLAEKMVREAESVLAEKGCDMIRLLVAEKNIPAQKTYARRGFRTVAPCYMFGHNYYACEKRLSR